MKRESGRSTVEMLGVLAVMGILSIAGIAAYKMAMQRYRSNELMNEANKRAYVVAMRLLISSSTSLSEFSGQTIPGMEFENDVLLWDKEFGIKVNNVEKAVCQNLFRMLGHNTVLRWISKDATGSSNMNAEDCAETNNLILGYNKNMEKNDQTDTAKSDYSDEAACVSARQSWCSNGQGSGLCYDNRCQRCDTDHVVRNQPNNTTCTYQGTTPSVCKAGRCVDPEVEVGETCATNDDCGGTDSGYFCNYNRDNGSRTCASLESKQFANTNLGIFYKSVNYYLPRESASNWCEAQGMELLDYTKLNCDDGTISGALVDTLRANWSDVTALWTSSDTHGVNLATQRCGTFSEVNWSRGVDANNYVICQQKK